MTDGLQQNIALSDEVMRRLRLARLPREGLAVGPGDGVQFDVVVRLSPPDAGLAAQVATLCPDIRVKVVQGTWHRS